MNITEPEAWADSYTVVIVDDIRFNIPKIMVGVSDIRRVGVVPAAANIKDKEKTNKHYV